MACTSVQQRHYGTLTTNFTINPENTVEPLMCTDDR